VTKRDTRSWREEFKYWASLRQIDRIREIIAPFVAPDPFTNGSSYPEYVVRSIYYDGRGFDFYYQKIEGLRLRKKLRVRGYNHTSKDSTVFFEIKHKLDRRVFKERAAIPITMGKSLLCCPHVSAVDAGEGWPRGSRIAADRFLWLKHKLALIPVMLVVYNREAFVDATNGRTRVTIDTNLRSLLFPSEDDLFTESRLRTAIDGKAIVELKFNGGMPSWMMALVKAERLTPVSISKYCISVDSWIAEPYGRPEELHNLPRSGW
jgi:hypothetical protein